MLSESNQIRDLLLDHYQNQISNAFTPESDADFLTKWRLVSAYWALASSKEVPPANLVDKQAFAKFDALISGITGIAHAGYSRELVEMGLHAFATYMFRYDETQCWFPGCDSIRFTLPSVGIDMTIRSSVFDLNESHVEVGIDQYVARAMEEAEKVGYCFKSLWIN